MPEVCDHAGGCSVCFASWFVGEEHGGFSECGVNTRGVMLLRETLRHGDTKPARAGPGLHIKSCINIFKLLIISLG